MKQLTTFAFGLTLVMGLGAPAHAADITEITKDDYYGAAYFRQALEHPKIAKQKSQKGKISMVARDLHWKPNKLSSAIEKVESLDGDAIDLAKKAVLAAVAKSKLKGRVIHVLVNDNEPKHVVMYLRWRGSNARDVVKEASELAALVAKNAPLISTLSLAAIHPKAADDVEASVWSAKIASDNMASIKESRIEDYADRLYKRLFEGVEETAF